MKLDEAIKIVQPPFVLVLMFKTDTGLGVIVEGNPGNGLITRDGDIGSFDDVATIVKDFFDQ